MIISSIYANTVILIRSPDHIWKNIMVINRIRIKIYAEKTIWIYWIHDNIIRWLGISEIYTGKSMIIYTIRSDIVICSGFQAYSLVLIPAPDVIG